MTEALPLTETSEEDQVAMITRFGFDRPMDLNELADMAFGPLGVSADV